MVILSKMIDWDSIEKEFSSFYDGDNSKGGKPPKPVRLMTGLLLLQHLHSLSDDQVVRGFVENPYWGCRKTQLPLNFFQKNINSPNRSEFLQKFAIFL